MDVSDKLKSNLEEVGRHFAAHADQNYQSPHGLFKKSHKIDESTFQKDK